LSPSHASPTRRPLAAAAALLIVVAATIAGSGLAAGPASAGEPVRYRPPVDAPVIDPFHLPTTPYGPGNRGLEYDTVPGVPVRASADGVVSFAGQVGGTLHVTVSHADGIRTSYSFLARIDVVLGQPVRQGQPVGAAGETFHFGARLGTAYLDPALLFGGAAVTVALLPLRPSPSAGGARWPPGARSAPLPALRALSCCWWPRAP
jgi:murein DD-endopeptidase MepM/ murein hydrolase activator NlpD